VQTSQIGMEPRSATLSLSEMPVLLRGEAAPIHRWIDQWSNSRALCLVLMTIIGTALFGAAVGSWRDALQAGYTALKFPLLILLTTLGTALLNGMLAPLLGLNIRFSQSLLAVLLSFTIFAMIVGSFSPLMFFLIWNTPPMQSAQTATAYRSVLLVQVAIIAFAGIAANVRLLQLLEHLSGKRSVAFKILFAWLAANLFLGSQLCWIMRPFIGSPGLPVQFLRPDAFRGNFYEAVFYSITTLLSQKN